MMDQGSTKRKEAASEQDVREDTKSSPSASGQPALERPTINRPIGPAASINSFAWNNTRQHQQFLHGSYPSMLRNRAEGLLPHGNSPSSLLDTRSPTLRQLQLTSAPSLSHSNISSLLSGTPSFGGQGYRDPPGSILAAANLGLRGGGRDAVAQQFHQQRQQLLQFQQQQRQIEILQMQQRQQQVDLMRQRQLEQLQQQSLPSSELHSRALGLGSPGGLPLTNELATQSGEAFMATATQASPRIPNLSFPRAASALSSTSASQKTQASSIDPPGTGGTSLANKKTSPQSDKKVVAVKKTKKSMKVTPKKSSVAAAGASKSASGNTPEASSDPNAGKLTGRQPVILYMPCDDAVISQYQCLARKQMELFEAKDIDVEAGAQGRNRGIVKGQVGIRCRHCAHLYPRRRTKSSTFYPSTLKSIYQTAQNMANTHLTHTCQYIPQPIRDELLKLAQDKKTSAGGGKEYWSDGARILGVYESDLYLRFTPRSSYVDAKASPPGAVAKQVSAKKK